MSHELVQGEFHSAEPAVKLVTAFPVDGIPITRPAIWFPLRTDEDGVIIQMEVDVQQGQEDNGVTQ